MELFKFTFKKKVLFRSIYEKNDKIANRDGGYEMFIDMKKFSPLKHNDSDDGLSSDSKYSIISSVSVTVVDGRCPDSSLNVVTLSGFLAIFFPNPVVCCCEI